VRRETPGARSQTVRSGASALQRVAAASRQPLIGDFVRGIGALAVLLAVFGSALALMPLLIAVSLDAGLIISPPRTL
jgi:hypothetical protein